MPQIFTNCKNKVNANFHSLYMDRITVCEFNRFMNWRFKELMQGKGLNQEQVAERLDCSVGQVNMLYSGKRKVHTGWIKKISDEFGIPAWQLFANPQDVVPKEYADLMAGYLALEPSRRRDFEDAMTLAKMKNKDDDGESSLKKTRRSKAGV